MIRFWYERIHGKHSVAKLVGAPGHVGYDEGSTNGKIHNPYPRVDERSGAHPDVMHMCSAVLMMAV